MGRTSYNLYQMTNSVYLQQDASIYQRLSQHQILRMKYNGIEFLCLLNIQNRRSAIPNVNQYEELHVQMSMVILDYSYRCDIDNKYYV